MRIGVMGAQNTGKTTFAKDFVEAWPMYTFLDESYTSIEGIKLNQEGDEDNQRLILNFLAEQIVGRPETDNVIIDRTVLDNLVYTMWLSVKGRVTDEFVEESIQIVKNSLVFYDIIFFCPVTHHSPIPIEQKEFTCSDPNYRIEINNLFCAMMKKYLEHSVVFFPFDHDLGVPAIIEMFGTRQERIQLAKFYIDDAGAALEATGMVGNDADMKQAGEDLAGELRIQRLQTASTIPKDAQNFIKG